MNEQHAQDRDYVDGYVREDLQDCQSEGVPLKTRSFDQNERNNNFAHESLQKNEKLQFDAPVLFGKINFLGDVFVFYHVFVNTHNNLPNRLPCVAHRNNIAGNQKNAQGYAQML